MHGHIYIILKESLKHIPVVGWGMQFYGFIFMSRKMETDRPRLAHRMSVLKEKHSGAMSGSPGFDPMWLLLFPEGTNFTKNTSQISAKYSEKANIPNLQNALLPRSTGLYFCLKELEGTVNYIYDCTIAYEGVK
jgi:lysocardiolipin and lysophospholipid acyltransferase